MKKPKQNSKHPKLEGNLWHVEIDMATLHFSSHGSQ
jgi:hypothetical protein